MNIDSRLSALLPDLTQRGFSMSSFAGTSDRSPSSQVTLTKTISQPGSAENPNCNSVVVSIILWVDKQARTTARIEALLPNLTTISRGGTDGFSYPHPHFDTFLTQTENAAKGAAYEVSGYLDREYLATLITTAHALLTKMPQGTETPRNVRVATALLADGIHAIGPTK